MTEKKEYGSINSRESDGENEVLTSFQNEIVDVKDPNITSVEERELEPIFPKKRGFFRVLCGTCFNYYRIIQNWTWKTIEGYTNLGTALTIGILIVVAITVILFIMSTSELFFKSPTFQIIYTITDYITIVLFTCEYLLRFWSCTSEISEYYKKYGVFLGKFFFVISILSLVDLMAVIPTYVSLILRYEVGAEVLHSLLALRVLRLVRLFKADRYLQSIGIIFKVIYQRRIELITSFFIQALFIIFTASILYVVEGYNNPPFKSVIDCIYWVMISLSTVKGGDGFGTPQTVVGRVLSCLIGFVCFSSFAVPTSILGSGFLAEHQKMMEIKRKRKEEMMREEENRRKKKLKKEREDKKEKERMLEEELRKKGKSKSIGPKVVPITMDKNGSLTFCCKHCHKKTTMTLF